MTTFLLMGSGEFEAWSHEVEAEALDGAAGDGRVAILPTASATEGDEVFERWGRMGLEHYAERNVPAEVVAVRTRDDALREDLAERIQSASMVFFSGGKPQHLAEVMDGSPSWDAVRQVIDRGGVYAGCSAGAMVASRSREQRASKPRRGTGWLSGLGLVPQTTFGVHWDRVRRIPGAGMFLTSRIDDGAWFVGIDERTAILGDGERWDVRGLGSVTVRGADGSAIYRHGDRFEAPASR
jgi:cyanophycinase